MKSSIDVIITIGRHIARTAAEKGHHVRMLTRRPANMPSADKLIEIREGDAQDIQTIRELLQDCDAVINTLGQPVRAVPIYSIVTSQLLEVMQEYGMRRYIGVSGGSLDVPGDKKRLVNRIGARAFDLFFPQLMADKRKELDILLQNQHIDWSLAVRQRRALQRQYQSQSVRYARVVDNELGYCGFTHP